MKQKLLITALPLVVALASASASANRMHDQSGVGCISASGTMTNLERSQYGVHNPSSTDGLTVECPVFADAPSTGAPTATVFGIDAYDRNSSLDVSCDLQRTAGNGNVTYTTHLQTSGSSAAVQGLTVLPNVSSLGIWHLRCWLPQATSDGFSHVVNYGLVTTDS